LGCPDGTINKILPEGTVPFHSAAQEQRSSRSAARPSSIPRRSKANLGEIATPPVAAETGAARTRHLPTTFFVLYASARNQASEGASSGTEQAGRQGRQDEARKQAKQARELRPLAPRVGTQGGHRGNCGRRSHSPPRLLDPSEPAAESGDPGLNSTPPPPLQHREQTTLPPPAPRWRPRTPHSRDGETPLDFPREPRRAAAGSGSGSEREGKGRGEKPRRAGSSSSSRKSCDSGACVRVSPGPGGGTRPWPCGRQNAHNRIGFRQGTRARRAASSPRAR